MRKKAFNLLIPGIEVTSPVLVKSQYYSAGVYAESYIAGNWEYVGDNDGDDRNVSRQNDENDTNKDKNLTVPSSKCSSCSSPLSDVANLSLANELFEDLDTSQDSCGETPTHRSFTYSHMSVDDGVELDDDKGMCAALLLKTI